MAVVSADHADESYNVENCMPSISSKKRVVRYFTPEEIEEHNNNNNNNASSSSSSSYWACIDGFVVDSTDFLNKHPGGRKKILSTNDKKAGDSGQPYDFSFSKGRNAHFPETAKIFRDGIQRYLNSSDSDDDDGSSSGAEIIVFPGNCKGEVGGKLVILGRLLRRNRSG